LGNSWRNLILIFASIGIIALGTLGQSYSQTASVIIPAGTAVPGCEQTNSCYIPFEITIPTGTTVTWTNQDSSAHTVTSGTPANGPDGRFDSSLIISGGTFSHTFQNVGTIDYFSQIQPWQTGIVNVVDLDDDDDEEEDNDDEDNDDEDDDGEENDDE